MSIRMNAIKDKIEQLRHELDEYNYNYYVLNNPTISDYDFDKKLKELEELETKYPEYFDSNSPTQRVGNDINENFKQVRHTYPMLSLSNTYSEKEVFDFEKRIRRLVEGEIEYVSEIKFDGSSISLTYENGALTRAVTRGDGSQGDDVTNNVKTIKSVPLRLRGNDYPSHFEIRGEIVMPFSVFKTINKQRESDGEIPFANPRNAAAGTLKMLNSSIVAERNLDAYFYAILGDELPEKTHYGNLTKAKEWGFKIPDSYQLCKNIDEVMQYIHKWDRERFNLDVATDGVVIKVNSLQMQQELGFTSKFPRWAIAYKFKAESATTQLETVTYQVGRTGAVTPVANLSPVLIAGTIVKRASLHNEDIINKLDLHENDTVYVEKGGEIIPKITGVDLSQRQPYTKAIEFIKECPVCGTELNRAEGEAAYYCPNENGCPPQIKGKIEHFVSRKALDIDGLGEETIDLLFSEGLVNGIADLYLLKEEQIIALDRFREKSAQRIITGVEASKKIAFERVLYGLGIRFVGETVAKTLVQKLHTIDNLINATKEELINIDEIGEKIADSILSYFEDDRNIKLISFLKEQGVQLAIDEEKILSQTNKLDGLKIVISGTFEKLTRNELKSLIEQNGGKNVSSISKNTSFIVAGDNMGPSKLEKAKKLGIEIISEDDFLKMIE